ncbi:bacteriohopanetetrol glucosamine biosynthesis glycosyltransferase HpnI [Gluconobacter kanchanaburiensis]|uniref:Glucosyltransferase n=1 Tax=Gluconobacter kanchanaburiensis NBRC 103587 TaxID=1307948 RepID=A0A511B6J5_9PROT|nr:bacteriohopanetetrol glucosamine biosynthesis glycosyltransferase HpnI [Gluconobacter kanchanaburiensis]MBF0861656.1 glycosyltransferase [Gluconobacter kanchanaburiensis]GBR67170.1 ceramide glucosyltransferase [Gluconobacter kanchanaburiensis NBRC 103587]GEK95302.1 glucosyltransferase [Gluconobacter kanchanaburiensis NBRC 103587]
MSIPLSIAAGFCACVSAAGNLQALAGAALLARFRRTERNAEDGLKLSDRSWPPVTVLKPLHGNEPLLEEALDSVFTQDYPDFQIVFGVQDADDTALPVIERLRTRYPHVPVSVVIDPREHGPNRKVGNLLNMYGKARHDVLVISDSDIHVSPGYLKHVVTSLEEPGTGLVTTLYAGRPAEGSLVQQIGACQINHNFLPGVMMSRFLGRQDCLGATMALRRQVLEEIGGLEALVHHVADDAELGQLVRARGETIAIAPSLTHTTVGEHTLSDLLAHELRWGRTVKNVAPVGYGLSAIQLPLFWAVTAVLFRPNAWWTWFLLALTWLVRAFGSSIVDRATSCPLPAAILLLPVRDWLSAAIMVGSARGSRVAWRGRTVHIARRKRNSASGATSLQADATHRSVRS